MLNVYEDTLLNKFIITSSKLVVLQALKNSYIYEINSNKPQTTKNFRSTCILEEARVILEYLEEFVEYFTKIELENKNQSGTNKLRVQQIKAIQKLLLELNVFYSWAIEEVKLKHARQQLQERNTFSDSTSSYPFNF